jgi:glutamate-ammonia-ligase adenylyltransferase
MMALTPAGRLYDVDVRLRPEGESGLLIASWDSFERYQLERAHVWEHQALTRARWVAGDIGLKARFDQLKERVLMQQRDHVDLWRMIQEMREKMRLQHPDLSHRFDIKKSRGGMIDIEFAVQYLVLGWGAVDSRLRENIGNIALLRHSGKQGYLSEAVAERAIEAYRSLRAVGHQSQLQGIEAMVPRDDPRVNEWKNAVEALYKGLPI